MHLEWHVMQHNGYAFCANSPESPVHNSYMSSLGLQEDGRNLVWSPTWRIPRSSARKFMSYSQIKYSAHKCIRNLQVRRIDGRGEWMNQFWPTIFRLKEHPLSFRQTRSRPSRTYQDSSYSHNMLEHFEQKFLSDEAVYSSGVPRFMTALYTLASVMFYTEPTKASKNT